LLAGNREGFNFREQIRSTPTIESRSSRPVWNHNELIRNNIIALNRDAQVWGWFDVKDNRHWPASNTAAPITGAALNAMPEINANMDASLSSKGQPQGLSLEKLQLRFEKNAYFAAPGQGWFNWGVTWSRNRKYADLTEFQSDLHIDHQSQALSPGFIDMAQRDFRLPSETIQSLQDNYPKGPIPGVRLGMK